MSVWDPTQYLRYGDERLRPFVELVARIGATDPRAVVDLGCGPGNATALLLERWPDAHVTGIDNSPAMIERANADPHSPQIEYVLGDALEFHEPGAYDVVVSNATLQWVPGHLDHFRDYVASLVAGGWFGFQVPAMQEAPSHATLYDLARTPRWRDRLAIHVRENWIESPRTYFDRLEALGCRVDVWETTYHHVLAGEDAVFEWTRGTSLRPFADALEGDERDAFLASYKAALSRLYRRDASGTIYPFRRLFVVAEKLA